MCRRLVFILFLLVPCCCATDKYTETKRESWDFAPGGKIEVGMRFGDLQVVPSDEPRLTITYVMHSKHKDFSRKVETKFDVGPSSAKLNFRSPNRCTIDVELKVPTRTDLYLRVLAGDITIGTIEGSKDIETHAGDIQIFLREATNLGTLDASTHAGDVYAPFGRAHGWIGNKLEYQGRGKYRLHAHTFAGDVNIMAPETTAAHDPLPDS